jgi:hypothetical protein
VRALLTDLVNVVDDSSPNPENQQARCVTRERSVHLLLGPPAASSKEQFEESVEGEQSVLQGDPLVTTVEEETHLFALLEARAKQVLGYRRVQLRRR